LPSGDYAIPQDMVSLSLGLEERFLVVASPGYFDQLSRPAVPADLLRHECIRVRMPSGAVRPWKFERHGEELRVDPPGRLILGSPRLAIQAAPAGTGIAYVVERSIVAELASGRLVCALTDWTPPFSGIALYYPRQRPPSAGLAAFIEHFKAWRRRQSIN
jgi:DNA-binding transcriptional LysR family regulator